MKNYKKTFSFIDAEKHRATIDAEITDRNEYPEFTASGTYLESAGQCLDNIKPATPAQFKFIHFWKNWHLKDVSKLHGFREELIENIKEIKKEELTREKKQEKENKTEDEKLLDEMEEYGIDEGDVDACRAYIEAMNTDDLSDFQESYNGQWDSDAEFTEDLLEQIGDLPELPHYIYIDWERTADAIMQDYAEQDGFYFRNI